MRKILLTLLAVFAFMGCNAQTSNNKMKAIVVYFSHAGENYSVGNIQTGNTKIVADYISEIIGADQAEIVTHKYDGMAYKPLCNLAQDEQIKDERPDFELVLTSHSDSVLTSHSDSVLTSNSDSGQTSNSDSGLTSNSAAVFADYDTIFIGSPVWWGTYPQVMFTFFDRYDLNGKTIYPFTTHEGSGLGSCVQDLKSNYPRADVRKGFSIYGHEVRNGKVKVEKWLQSL